MQNTTAETIYFHGAIVESSCSSASQNNECNNLSKVINNTINTHKIDQLLQKKSKDVAHIYLTNTFIASKNHKVLVVNYH
jgi:hypothetical protein